MVWYLGSLFRGNKTTDSCSAVWYRSCNETSMPTLRLFADSFFLVNNKHAGLPGAES